jgi:hypothetical protein
MVGKIEWKIRVHSSNFSTLKNYSEVKKIAIPLYGKQLKSIWIRTQKTDIRITPTNFSNLNHGNIIKFCKSNQGCNFCCDNFYISRQVCSEMTDHFTVY